MQKHTRDSLLDLIEQRRKEWDMSLRAIAQKAGVTYDNLKDLKYGRTQMLRGDVLQKLLGFLNSESHDKKDYIYVPVCDVRVSAGHGSLVNSENTLYNMAFQSEWLRRVTSSPVNMLCVVRVDGDSMEPTLSPDDTVLVDRTQLSPKRDGIYVIRYDEDVLVKRIQYDPQRQIVKIISDNESYPPLEISDLASFAVIGRVIWLGRRV